MDKYPEAYIQFLIHFHGSRDFFECHEILEEHWKRKKRGNRDAYWTGLIQLAVALYHHRRANHTGALKLFRNSEKIIQAHAEKVERLAIDTGSLLHLIDEKISDVLEEKPYADMNLPLTDESLIEACKKRCRAQQIEWQRKSDLDNPYLVHKHMLRDDSTFKIEK
ncbi:DUF309 domain-containing protein [Alteribacillus iranensis]|uniref:DUF309 domain-containing protein n=1 Tax=Alteribacillus iranensis TaxID=930128 RepID=A0A1I1ZLQ2_9BACI|nr:DUF309 domain-containing protein [Alteribacillus iranensis]SFE32609.1 hypothetical protein SAMN05192532_101316 [Alteribacillus iranensis]